MDLVQIPSRTLALSPLRLGILCSVSTALMAAVACLFAVLNHHPLDRLNFLLAEPVAALVGGLIIGRQPRNPVGWLIVGHAACLTLAEVTRQYALYGVLTDPGALPLAVAAAWPAQWLWGPGVGLGALVPLFFPNGRLPSPHWRIALWYSVVAMAVTTVTMAFARADHETPGIINPLGIIAPPGPGSWYDWLLGTLLLSSVILTVTSLAMRFWWARHDERQQIKWLLFALMLVIGQEVTLRDVRGVLSAIVFSLTFMSPWVAIGIAVLRYRLYDIDILINRTLVYGTLTALVIGLYVFIVGYLGTLFQTSGSLVISLVATGVVAVVFQPLRARVQRNVNRLIFGERDEPYAVVTRLGQRLEATPEPAAVLPTTVETLAHALRLPYVAIVLEHGGREPALIEAGQDPEVLRTKPTVLHSFPLTYHGQTLGELRVAPRVGESDLSRGDQRLLADVARQIGVAAHAVLLTIDLEQARLRIVNEREAARRRLGSDLHDSVGHQLTALARKAETAANLADREPGAARAVLAELTRQCNATAAHVRQLAHHLHPPDLELLGLLGAIQERVHSLSELRVTVNAPAELPPLPVAVETAAYYIVQEALTNVQRHANARTCHVRIALTGGNVPPATLLLSTNVPLLEVVVSDDGQGLPRTGSSGAGLGLLSMQQRAAEIGGACTIGQRPDGGTLVRALLPVLQPTGQEI